MPIAPSTGAEAPLRYKVYDIIKDAFIEIGACPPGEEPSSDEAQWGLRKFNYLTDVWSAQEAFVYSYAFLVFNLVAGLSLHTIGPSGVATFPTGSAPRPVRLESAALLLNITPGQVDLVMTVQDHKWWALQQVKAIQTGTPTDVFYSPTFPDGSLYFWPVPNITAAVRLQVWTTVSQFVSIQDPIGGPGGPGTLPPAYRAAMMLTLAEDLLSGSNREASPTLGVKATKARAAIFGNNTKSPRMRTQDSGMPRSGAGGKRDFNWATGGRAGGAPE
jgi:hypothetical protein